MGILQRFKTSSFLRHNAVLFIGSVLVGVLNYVYYPILGRMLSLEAYGEVQALISLFLQLTIFLTVFSQITTNVVANYTNEDQKNKVIFELEKVALFMALALFAGVCIFGWKLRSFFHFESAWPFIIVAIAVVATVPLVFRSAFLRGHKKFAPTSNANIIGALGKILFSVSLVALGWSTFGAVCGVVIAQLLAFAYVARIAYRFGFVRPAGSSHRSLPDWKVLRPELKYGLLVLGGSFTITLLSAKQGISALSAGIFCINR